MRAASLCVTLLAILSGSLLLFTAGHSRQDIFLFLLLGLFSLVAALTYTIGRHAYGYHGLGDLAVLVFFGWVAVGGSFYLQAHALAWPVFLPATACGLLSAVVLNANNLRDLEEDRLHGKITFAAMLGMRRAKIYVQLLLLASLLYLAAFAVLCLPHRPWAWLFLIALPLFYRNAAILRRARQPEDFQPQLATALKLNMAALGGLAVGLLIRG
jgi:1,4-dihydroxy-2-naphthoate octaprenyltransferase